MIDAPEDIRQFLINPGTDPAMSAKDRAAAAALYALVGERIWHGELPDGFDNTETAIVMVIAGGAGTHPTAAVHDLAVNFTCYGAADTFEPSRALYRALHDRLHKATVKPAGDSEIIRSDEVTPGQSITDPDTGWPSVFTSYEIKIQ
jgi:hypothetical protein